jgi:tetratricopeptide (TPR) repeat protein
MLCTMDAGGNESPWMKCFNKGDALFEKAEFKVALERYCNALKLLKAEGDIDQGVILNRIGKCFQMMERLDEAVEHFSKVLPLVESDPALVATTLRNLCSVHVVKCNWREARELAQRRFDITAKLGNDSEHVYSHDSLAEIAFGEKKFEEALSWCEKGLKLAKDDLARSLLLNIASLACDELEV